MFHKIKKRKGFFLFNISYFPNTNTCINFCFNAYIAKDTTIIYPNIFRKVLENKFKRWENMMKFTKISYLFTLLLMTGTTMITHASVVPPFLVAILGRNSIKKSF